MALIKCDECGKEISDKANVCPNCGYKKPLKPLSKLDKIFIPILSIAIVAGIIGLCITPTLIKHSYPNMKTINNGENQYIYEKIPGSNIAKQTINPNYKSTVIKGKMETDYSKAIVVGTFSILVPSAILITYIIMKKKEKNFNGKENKISI